MPMSLQEFADSTSRAVVDALRAARIIEFCEYVSKKVQELAERVQKLFYESKHLIFFTCMSAVAFCLDPATFFGAMLVGAVSNFMIEYLYGTLNSPKSIFVEKAYELFLIQTTLVGVSTGCMAVQAFNFQYFPSMWREGSVSGMLGGVVAGATVAALVRRLCTLVANKLWGGGAQEA